MCPAKQENVWHPFVSAELYERRAGDGDGDGEGDGDGGDGDGDGDGDGAC